MQKSLFVILIAALAVEIGSQEVQIGGGTLLFTGKVASGVFFDSDDAEKEGETGPINPSYYGSEGKVYLWNESDAKTGLRAELSARYTNGNNGFRIRLRADNALQGNPNTAIGRYAYGWLNLFDEAVKFTGGFIDLSDNVWGTLGDGDWDIGGNGIRMEFKPFHVKPLQGLDLGELNIGAFLLVPLQSNPNKIHDENMKEISGDVTFSRVFGETAFGFRWTHPWFYVSAQVQMDADVDGKEIMDASRKKVWSGAGDEMRFMFGAGFTLLPELLVTAEGNFEGLGNWAARGTGDLRQTIQYDFSRIPVPVADRFVLGVKARERLWGYDVKELSGWDIPLKPWIQIKPFAAFKASAECTVSLEFGYAFGHLALANPYEAQQLVYESSNLHIKPTLTYKLKNGLELKAWYMFNRISYGNLSDSSPIFADRKNSYNLARKADNRTLVESLVKQQIALEFVWSF
ncbi:MAG: hypothetical protein LBF60_06970 [Treponema sp.]|jgi:hypothetical protein|nr:hypothetical protein [Treponema sp.]